MNNKNVAVLGGGSFGTVLANLAASNGYQVRLWVRDSEQALRINSEGANKNYHPELKLSENIYATDDLYAATKQAAIIFVATPSLVFENVINRLHNNIPDDVFIISCTKGIKEKPFRTMSDIINQKFSNNKIIGVLSGPNLAKEIADQKVAGTVVASKNKKIQEDVKQIISSNFFKVYSSEDVYGVELSGALKNIYAIICGISESLDVGENALGLILTRSMAEMSRFAVANGGNPMTFLGLSGMGDLVATCTSKLSRNYKLGLFIGRGYKLEDAKEKVGQVAEGLRTLLVIKHQAEKENISMPLVDSLYKIIYESNDPKSIIKDLVNNPHEIDVEFTYTTI
tara:strand:- start:1273 stop:2295 length:1023 start_codon:yes stop_codon:yes gene_type:complete